MKKIGLLLIAVVLIGTGIAYYLFQTQGTPSDTGYADYLPPDTLAIISLRDVNGLTDLFPQTALGNFLSKETMGRILADLKVDSGVIRDYEKNYDQLFAVVQHPGFRMVFGDDVDLALLPIDADLFVGNPQKALERSLVIMATTSSSKALETFARSLLHKDVTEFVSGDLSLTRISLDEKRSIYAYTQGNRLILALDSVAIKRCLAAQASGETLQQENNFVAVMKFWQGRSMTRNYSRGFVQLDRLQPYLLASEDKEVQQAGRYLEGMQYVATVGGRTEDAWKVESSSRYNYEFLHPAIKELVDSASEENATLHLLGENPLIYSWSSSLGSSALLETLSATEDKQYKELDAKVQQELGFSLDKVVQAFGPQYGMTLKEIVQEGLFPLPKLVFFLQVKDHQVAEALLNQVRRKAAARGMAGEQQQQLGEYIVYSWPLLPGEVTQPAVVLTEDMLYLANGPASLQGLLSTEKKRDRLPPLVAKELGSVPAGKVQAANNGALVFYPGRFANQVQGAADWLAGIIEASQGGSITVLKDELLVLLQSTEVTVFVSDLFADYGQAMVSFKDNQEDAVAGE